jgi:hemerythrin-like domain-containing protein
MVSGPSATELLVREHRVIARVLDGLERRLDEARATGRIDAEYLRRLVAFSRLFIERCHHAKEEVCLFPCLVRRGIPEQGPIAVMLDEHRTARLLVAQISGALDLYMKGEADLYRVLNPCQRFLDLLRQHIHKEDHMLFPMGESVMMERDHEESVGCFEAQEGGMGADQHARLLNLAEELSGG